MCIRDRVIAAHEAATSAPSLFQLWNLQSLIPAAEANPLTGATIKLATPPLANTDLSETKD